MIEVYFHGKTKEEAFNNFIKIVEIIRGGTYIMLKGDLYAEQYYSMHPEDKNKEITYHVPYAMAYFALRSYRNYFGDYIPNELISTFEDYLNNETDNEYNYDITTGTLDKVKPKIISRS